MDKVITPIIDIPDELRDLVSEVTDFVGENCDKNDYWEFGKKNILQEVHLGKFMVKKVLIMSLKFKSLRMNFFKK